MNRGQDMGAAVGLPAQPRSGLTAAEQLNPGPQLACTTMQKPASTRVFCVRPISAAGASYGVWAQPDMAVPMNGCCGREFDRSTGLFASDEMAERPRVPVPEE